MESEVSGSFRDPAGFVFRRDGVLLRQVNTRHREHYDHLRSSGLYDELVSRSLLIAHDETDASLSPDGGAYKVLRPEPVAFISHPYEWCFGQLKDAALLTLEIQSAAMDHEMSLRDSSAYNVQFHRGSPTLIDTLSFEKIPEGRPWVAYRQFCQHFLAPLALMAHVDVRLVGLMRNHIDGVPLDLAASLLPSKTKMRPGLGLHVHSHAKAQARGHKEPSSERTFSERAFRGLIDSLRSAVERLEWSRTPTTWSEYYEEAESYSSAALEDKKSRVVGFLDRCEPASVWDLGANVGVFSRLASTRKVPTVAFDVDYGCLEANYRRVRSDEDEYLLPLFCDLTNPSPGVGWDSSERESLVDRGPVELAMALALVHHLAIGNNVPLPRVADLFRKLCRMLIVEFVPKEDPKAQLLLSHREDIFDGYHLEGFEDAFLRRFEILESHQVKDSPRVLYLMRGR